MADRTPFLVINPNAEDRRLGKQLDKILAIAKDTFGDFSYELTKKMGDGIPIARRAVAEGYKVLVSVGGDGTLNEVVNVAAKTDLKVGMIPGGSACDSFKTHGIPRNFKRAFEIVSEGYYERFPVGLAKGDSERYFIEMVNGAFIGLASANLADRFEWAHNEIGYGYAAIRTALEFKLIPSKITIDNKIVREGDLAVIAVSLTDVISDFIILPGNNPRIGDFGIIIGKDLTKWKLVRQLLRSINGKHIPNKAIEIFRGKHVVIESAKPHMWESEGEIASRNSTRMEVTYIPDAINLIIPKGWQYSLSKKDRTKEKKKVLKKLPPYV
ncbi:MAG TPA: diacylglycerol kinase family protein [Candidatus Bathyarchaeia archaeon]|nr:diacylglycerol kinase family protein [Candidatus Bathyarchaeia archaeon]